MIFLTIPLFACVGMNQSDLEGTVWALMTYNDTIPIAGARPTLQFEDGQVSGNASCNHYGGSYEIEGDTIRFGDLFNTEMACLEPEGVMEQEQKYLEMLRSAQRFEMDDGVLRIHTASGGTLTFEKE
jgi:heat shock protein HslJ